MKQQNFGTPFFKNYSKVLLVLLSCIFSFMLYGAKPVPDQVSGGIIEEFVKKISDQKQKLDETQKRHRRTLGVLFQLNTKIKKMSETKQDVNRNLLTVQNEVQFLASEIAKLQSKLSQQKTWLAKRLHILYKIRKMGAARLLLQATQSASSGRDIQYMKYLAQKDVQEIKSYKQNLQTLRTKNAKLSKRVADLISERKKVKTAELQLEASQLEKTRFLRKLRASRSRLGSELEGLKFEAQNLNLDEGELANLFGSDFNEQKGRLPLPLNGVIVRTYGLEQDPVFRFSIFHKGIAIQGSADSRIKVFYKGRVEYSGLVKGVGQVVLVSHGDNFYSVYTGLNERLVHQGQRVQQGQVLADGLIYPYQLHFEIRHFSESVDPFDWYLKQNEIKMSRQNNTETL